MHELLHTFALHHFLHMWGLSAGRMGCGWDARMLARALALRACALPWWKLWGLLKRRHCCSGLLAAASFLRFSAEATLSCPQQALS
jgi:hypothetical protein